MSAMFGFTFFPVGNRKISLHNLHIYRDLTAIDFDVVVARASFILKQDQNICIKAVCWDDRDVFVQLPTGFGKSIIYQIIPRVKAALVSGEGRQNMQVIVVSPLV